MISRGSMGKQLTGNRTKKMAKGGKASGSLSGGSKASSSKSAGGSSGVKASVSKGGSNSGGGGGGGFLSKVGNAIRGAFSGGAGRSGTVTDPKTGKSYARPSYGAVSMKGLTSSDPANVARNRAAAAQYAAAQNRLKAFGMDRGDEARNAEKQRLKELGFGGGKTTPEPTVPTTPTGRVYTPAPVGYRPGIDPEWNYYQPKPTVALKKGGKVKPKGKK